MVPDFDFPVLPTNLQTAAAHFPPGKFPGESFTAAALEGNGAFPCGLGWVVHLWSE